MKKIFTLGLIIGCVGIFEAHAESAENVEVKETTLAEQVTESVRTEPVKVVEQKIEKPINQKVETMIEDEIPEIEEPEPEIPEVELEPTPIEDVVEGKASPEE